MGPYHLSIKCKLWYIRDYLGNTLTTKKLEISLKTFYGYIMELRYYYFLFQVQYPVTVTSQ